MKNTISNLKQTKIVCSISDFRCDVKFLKDLYDAGMNVVRMNTAHATVEGMTKVINNVRAVSHYVGILIDTKGPEIRTTGLEAPITYTTGQIVKIFGRPEMDTYRDVINLSYENFANDVHVGNSILFDDGAIEVKVREINGPMVIGEVMNDGVLGAHKSVNVPGVHIDLPAITEKDYKNILFAIDKDIDFIAHSFVRSKDDVLAIQKILDEHNSDIKIISKIENQEGVDNIDEIIEASYGIMVARGDLGIEVPLKKIPGIQRMIINKCMRAKKPVIVATQLLHTMIKNPRPTRAEVTDIANAVHYHTDALMLSGETASGKYPVEAVKTMAAIAQQAERDESYGYGSNGYVSPLNDNNDITEFLSRNAIEATERLGIKGIITDSLTGRTARYLSAFRGSEPILAICYKEKTQRWLALSYGVTSVAQHGQIGALPQLIAALRMLRQKGYIKMDDKIAHLSGDFRTGGGTTYLEISSVQEIFDRFYKFR